MYSLAVGPCSAALIFQLFPLTLLAKRQFGLTDLVCTHSASQYIFSVTTMPASKASQTTSGNTQGAAASKSTVSTIFTSSHPNNPVTAVPGLPDDMCLRTPRANSAAGITTAIAPEAAVQPAAGRRVRPQAAKATRHPTRA